MKFKIFDVSHGFCGLITTSDGKSVLVDAGHDGDKFKPSAYLANNRIYHLDGLLISNFDEDHVSDLYSVAMDRRRTIGSYFRNPTVDSAHIRREKQRTGWLTPNMSVAMTLHDTYAEPTVLQRTFGDLNISYFYVIYPYETDTNNLSLVTFFECGGITVLYPGDIERPGWEKLITNQEFLDMLRGVDIFIASHHGRQSGYYSPLFNYVTPDIFIISDKSVVHATQQNNYASHAKGINFGYAPNIMIRKVFTTRRDGNMELDINPVTSSYWLSTQV